MFEQDETGWGPDLGFPKKVMVLAPSDEEDDVYYRANVLEVDRKRKLVTLEYTESQGYGRHKTFTLPLDHKRIWRCTCDANRWEKLFADARQRQRRCKHSGGWRAKPGAERIAYSELPIHEQAKAATKEAGAARDTSKHERRRQRQHQRKQRKHQRPQHGNSSNSLRQKLVRLASLIGSACGIQPSGSRYPAAADPSTTGKAGSSGSDLCSQDSSSDNSSSEDSSDNDNNSSSGGDEGSESDSSSSSSHGEAAGEGAAQLHANGDSVLLHPHRVGGGNATAAGQAVAVAAGCDSGSAGQAPAAGSRGTAAARAAAAIMVAGDSEPAIAAPAVGVGGRKRRAAADGVTAASLAAAFNAGKSGSAKRVRITATSSTAAAAAAPAKPDTEHPAVGLLSQFNRQQQQQQHRRQCADTPATAAVAAADSTVSSVMVGQFQLHILSVQRSRGACHLYIAQCQLTRYAMKCWGLPRETMREATQFPFVRKGRIVATAAQVELLNQAGAAMHCNARYLLRLDAAAHICDRRDMHSAAAALRAAQLNMAAAAAGGGRGPLAATTSPQQQQCQRGSVDQQSLSEASGGATLQSIVIDGFTLHLLQDQHRDSSCIYHVAASQLSRYAQQCCGLHRKAVHDTHRTLKASITVCTDAQQQLLLNAKAVQHTRRHGNARLLSLPLAVDVCQKCGLLTAAKALEALLQQPAAAAALSHDAAAVNTRADEAGHQRQPQPPADEQTDSMRPDIQHQEAARKPSNTSRQPDLLTPLAAAVAAAKAAVVIPDRPASSAAVPPAAQEAALRPVRIDGYQLHLLPVSSGSGSPEYFIAQHQLVKLIRQVTGLMYSVDSKVDEACQEAESAVVLASIHQQQLLLSYGVLDEPCECRLLPLDAAASVLAHFDMDDASEALLAAVGQQVVDQAVDEDVDQGADHGVIQAADQSLDPAGDQDNQSSEQGVDEGVDQYIHQASGQDVVQGVDQASHQQGVDQVVAEASHQVVDQFVSQGVGQSEAECVDQGGNQGAVPGVTVGSADSPAVSGLGQQQNQQQRQTSLQQQRQQQEEEEESEPCDHSRQQKQLLEPPAVSQQTGPSGHPDAASAAAATLQRPAVSPVQMTSSTVLQQQLQQLGLDANEDSNQPGLQPAQQQQQQLSSSASEDQLQQKVAIAVAPASFKQAAGYRGVAVHSEPPASAAPASVPGSLEGPQVMDLGEPSGPQQVADSGTGAASSAQAAAGDEQQHTAFAAAASAEATPRAATFAPVAAAAGPTQPVTTADMDNPPPSAPPPRPPAAAAPVVPAAALTCIQLPGNVELCVLRAADNTAWLLYEHFQRYAVNSHDTLIRTTREFDHMFTEIAQYSKHTVRTRKAAAAEQQLLAASGKLAAGSRSTKLVLLEVAAATFEQLTLFEAAIALLTAPAQDAPAPAPAPPMLGPTSRRAVSPALVLDRQSADSQVAGQATPAAVSRSQPRQMQGGTAFQNSSPQQEVVQQTESTPAQQTASSLARDALDTPQQDRFRQEQHRDEEAPHEADAAPGLRGVSQNVMLSHALQQREHEHKQHLQEEAQKQQQHQQEDEAVDLTKTDASFKAAGDVGIRPSSRISSPRTPLAAVQVDQGFNVLAGARAEANDCIDLTADD